MDHSERLAACDAPMAEDTGVGIEYPQKIHILAVYPTEIVLKLITSRILYRINPVQIVNGNAVLF